MVRSRGNYRVVFFLYPVALVFVLVAAYCNACFLFRVPVVFLLSERAMVQKFRAVLVKRIL